MADENDVRQQIRVYVRTRWIQGNNNVYKKACKAIMWVIPFVTSILKPPWQDQNTT